MAFFRGGGFDETWSHVWLLANGGTVIDITGDQFRFNSRLGNFDVPVYVGLPNWFYEMFDDLEVRGFESLKVESLAQECRPRLLGLYATVMRHMAAVHPASLSQPMDESPCAMKHEARDG